jgi:TPR repeat protein
MKQAWGTWWSAAVCAAAALCFALTAFAASTEDNYRAGLKFYQGGDVTGAMAQLRKASDAGHAPAQVLLADILDQAEMNEEAVTYYRKAAEQGHADGEYGLGNMYLNGEGVKRDLAEARKWISRAAEKNHPRATTTLAQAYISGGLGLDDKERSSEDARRWVTRAADSNHVPAMDYLAKAYRAGLMGFAVDPKQAEAWEARASKMRGLAANRKNKKL